MNYSKVKILPSQQFKRLVGIQPSTFAEMLEDQLLMTLSYWREYRILFHIAMTYGIHESSASRIIQKIENLLIKSDKFYLPKKLPQSEGADWGVIVIDATEMTIERPKK